MTGALRIGVLDSGVTGAAQPGLRGRRFLADGEGGVGLREGVDDRLGHGSAVTRLILAAAPEAELIHAQVFDERFTTSPALVAAGLDWLREEGVALVNMSFGLRADRAVLRMACRAAAEHGILLVAAAPAQGPPCFPAAYAEVLAVTGDARCAPGEVSDLQGRQADFGTWCASPERGGGAIAGASAAAAHFTGLAARLLLAQPGLAPAAVSDHFRAQAIRRGPERRAPMA
ncbi:MAG: S8 family serine peptidase [Kiloniellales bacterium]|nr:S8 family serine peptidase [Kiloniellales bacterium]